MGFWGLSSLSCLSTNHYCESRQSRTSRSYAMMCNYLDQKFVYVSVIRVHFYSRCGISMHCMRLSNTYSLASHRHPRVNLLQQTLLLQVVGDDLDSLLNAGLLAVDVDLCVLRGLVRSADASELLDLARASLLVQTLGVALLSLLNGNVNEDLDEGKRSLAVLGVVVEITGDLTVGLVGRDEGGKSNGGAVGEELGDLLSES